MSLRHLTTVVALRELAANVREEGTNDGPRVRLYLRNAGIAVPAPWCAAFVQFCSDEAANELLVTNPLDAVKQQALVQSYHNFSASVEWIIPPAEADVGDLVLYNLGGSRWDHIGIVVVPPGRNQTFVAIEGNTNDDGAREGYEVAMRSRKIVAGRTAFARWDARSQPNAQVY